MGEEIAVCEGLLCALPDRSLILADNWKIQVDTGQKADSSFMAESDIRKRILAPRSTRTTGSRKPAIERWINIALNKAGTLEEISGMQRRQVQMGWTHVDFVLECEFIEEEVNEVCCTNCLGRMT